jgi:hypothetical protein
MRPAEEAPAPVLFENRINIDRISIWQKEKQESGGIENRILIKPRSDWK